MHGTLVVMDVYGRSRCGSGVQLSCSTSIRGLRDRAQAFMGSRLRHGPWNIPSQIQLYELPGCLRRLVLDVVLALAPVKVTERDFRLCRTLLVSGFVLWVFLYREDFCLCHHNLYGLWCKTSLLQSTIQYVLVGCLLKNRANGMATSFSNSTKGHRRQPSERDGTYVCICFLCRNASGNEWWLELWENIIKGIISVFYIVKIQ